MYSTNYREKRFNTVHHAYNGGFIMYFQLYKSMIVIIMWFYGLAKRLKATYDINVSDDFKVSRKARIKFFLLFIAKTPWWLLIKPFGWFIVIRTHYQGEVYYFNGEVDRFNNLKKHVTIKLRRIPLIKFPWYYTEKDLDYVSK
ncbi:hypothetical protein PBI_SCTP2_300 [Salicola phage SCTP-2]|nr:hypothetical protein PBI_SCTP2_300 [Salicola phage SCTP-2]